jgi:hypothetical protein
MDTRPPTSFRLSAECRKLIRRLAEALGVRDAAVVEIAVRRMARQELPGARKGTGKPRRETERRARS